MAGLHGHLKDDGIALDFSNISAKTTQQFFLAYTVDEQVALATKGLEAFQTATRSEGNGVRDWSDQLMKLIPMYVLQWTTENAELKGLNFTPLFGKLLSNLLACSDTSA